MTSFYLKHNGYVFLEQYAHMRRLIDVDKAFAKPPLEANASNANFAQVFSNQRNHKVLPEQIAHLRRASHYFVIIFGHVVCWPMT